MKNLLVVVGLWLARLGGWEPVQPDFGLGALIAAIRPMVAKVADAPQSGEWKRHQVYADAIKALPDVPKGDIALAIELALRS